MTFRELKTLVPQVTDETTIGELWDLNNHMALEDSNITTWDAVDELLHNFHPGIDLGGLVKSYLD